MHPIVIVASIRDNMKMLDRKPQLSSHNIIHRDLKAANLLMDEHEVKTSV